MKRAFAVLCCLLVVLAALAVWLKASHADTKVSALTVDTTPYATDRLYEVKDPTGTPASRAVAIGDAVEAGLTRGSFEGVNWTDSTIIGTNVNWQDVEMTGAINWQETDMNGLNIQSVSINWASVTTSDLQAATSVNWAAVTGL